VQRTNKHLLRHYTCVLIVVLIQSTALAQKPDTVRYRQLADYPFVFVSDSIVTTPPVITDSLFDAIAHGVRFQVNRTEIPSNDPFISLYNDSLIPWLKAHNLILRQVFVKGGASPEGPYDNNMWLSRRRAFRLIDFLSSNLDQPIAHQPINSRFVTEDYAYLVRLMELAGDAETRQVKAIWDACRGDERLCKQKLMALNGGTTWKRLLKTYFPKLRQSRLVLWYMVNPEYMGIPKCNLVTNTDLLSVPGIASYLPLPVCDTAAVQSHSRRHLIAIRTNLLHDFLYVPQFGFAPGGNIQLEYYPLSGHYTYNAGFTFTNHRHWNTHKFMQIRDFQLELRRYFKGEGQFIGTFVDAYVQGMKYGIGFSETKGWQGEGGGAGIGLGHSWNLNKRGNLRLELSMNVGFFVTRYDPYVWGNGNKVDGKYYYDYHGNISDFKKRNHQFVWFGPTNAGIHMTYDIIYRKQRKEGQR